MIRSMFTAISSLNLNQTFLDVISDNLANSNTTGFKASRVIFQDQFAQIMSSGAAPIGNSGGINPTEVGLGVKLGYISPTFTQGMMQATGRSTDLAVQGNGFFVYTNGQETRYSREGSLEIDADGYLVNNSTGMRITGWMIAPGSTAAVDTNQPATSMQISLDATMARATNNASLGGNLDSGLALPVSAAAHTLNVTNFGAGMTGALSAATSPELATGTYHVVVTTTGTGPFNYSAQLLDSSNNSVGAAIVGPYAAAPATPTIDFLNGVSVTLPTLPATAASGDVLTGTAFTYTHSVTAAVGETKDTTIAVYDSLGASHTPNIRFQRTSNPLVWDWSVTAPAGSTGNGTLSFTSDGRYNGSTIATPVVIPGSVGADNINLNIDLSKLTMLSADTTLSPRNQDGLAAGSVSELYGAPNTGEMYLVYSNGLKQLVGQLALAHFTNPSGLLRAGGNQFKIGLNSGEPQIGTANTGGRGAITSGYLEASNVDMAQEFTNMILAQRSFQASTRVITTSDQILQELVNLKQ